jgi:hypothetical protein
VTHNTQIKSEKEIRQSKPPTSISNVVAQYQVEKWEEKKEGMETTLFKKQFNTRFSGKGRKWIPDS